MALVPQVFMFVNCLIYVWHSDQCMDNIVKSCTSLKVTKRNNPSHYLLHVVVYANGGGGGGDLSMSKFYSLLRQT
jgi:hypothetical protein